MNFLAENQNLEKSIKTNQNIRLFYENVHPKTWKIEKLPRALPDLPDPPPTRPTHPDPSRVKKIQGHEIPIVGLNSHCFSGDFLKTSCVFVFRVISLFC